MLARTYIEKLIYSGQQAKEKLSKDNNITILDVKKALADLDFVEDRLKAAKILLREELKELEKE
jgi:hypothetical protein